MKPKFVRPAWMVLALMVLTFAVLPACVKTAAAADDPGKAVFEAQKCNTCHSVEAVGIVGKTPSMKAPDLSAIGATKTADWITKFLKKQEMLNGKKHLKEFTGKDEDLQALAKWLESLKGKK